MKKIPFNLQDWLSDKSQKIVDEKGVELFIESYRFDTPYPVIAHYKNQVLSGVGFMESALFLVTDEPELTEFEEAVYGLLEEVRSFDEPFSCDELVEYAKKEAQKLLTIARKQIEAEKQRKPSPALTKIVENLTPEKLEKAKKEMEEVVNYDKEMADLCDGTMSLTSKDIAKHFYNLGKSEALKEQKPAEPKAYLDLSMDAIEACMLRYLQSAANRKNDCEVIEDTREYKKQLVDLIQKPKWKPQPESLEALMYAIEGDWEKIKPTGYLSRRLEDLYDGLVNTFNVDETFLAELPKVAAEEDIEGLKALKRKIEESMEQKPAEVETPANLDLEKEIDKTVEECTDGYKPFDWNKFAEHFYNLGKSEALKDLPKWKKADEKEHLEERCIVLHKPNDLWCSNYAEEGEYYIPFSELEKLPKE